MKLFVAVKKTTARGAERSHSIAEMMRAHHLNLLVMLSAKRKIALMQICGSVGKFWVNDQELS